MPVISRIVDKNNQGGKLQRSASTVYANGQKVALHPSPVSSHNQKWIPKHRNSKTTKGSPSVYADGSPVVRAGSSTSCGHSIIAGGGVTVYVP